MSEDGLRLRLNAEMDGMSSALDVGCGPGRYLNTLPPRADRFGLDAVARNLGQCRRATTYHGRAQDLLPSFRDEWFDAVYAIDFIEHMDAGDAAAVIAEMKRIARRKVVLFTPYGFMPQDGAEFEPDEAEWQTHRSGWLPEDLPGFVTEVWPFDFGKPTEDQRALWAVWTR